MSREMNKVISKMIKYDLIAGVIFVAWSYTKAGKKWLKNL